MPKQSPVPNEIDEPFYRAANEERLVVQHCARCDRFQFPPEVSCPQCERGDELGWREVEGRGTIYSFAVVYDTPIASLQPDQPYNVAIVDVAGCPGVNMYSHLPGTAPGDVTIGAEVRVLFEATPATGQKVPEWRLA